MSVDLRLITEVMSGFQLIFSCIRGSKTGSTHRGGEGGTLNTRGASRISHVLLGLKAISRDQSKKARGANIRTFGQGFTPLGKNSALGVGQLG